MPDRTQLNRRQILKLFGYGAGAAALNACGAAPATLASTAAPDAVAAPTAGAAAAPTAVAASGGAKKYDGVTLRMLTQAGTDYEPALKMLAQNFQNETGAKVEMEFAAWETLMPKVQADLASGSPQFDLFANDVEFQYTIYPNLLPINDLLKQANYPMDGYFPLITKYGEGFAGQTACATGCR
jgi:ABC-type glycerol-3-phosphate transport system substrate-binding protein